VPPFADIFQEVAIMSLRPSYKGQTREELRFNSELGWLTAMSIVIAQVFDSMPW
jgi:hypothetical protein